MSGFEMLSEKHRALLSPVSNGYARFLEIVDEGRLEAEELFLKRAPAFSVFVLMSRHATWTS